MTDDAVQGHFPCSPPVRVVSAAAADPRFVALAAAQQAELVERYGGGEPMCLPVNRLVEVLLALDGDDPVGCVALAAPPEHPADPRPLTGSTATLAGGVSAPEVPDQAVLGEIKRLYVTPAARRRGVSRMLMGEVESRAARRGLAALVLESGTAQPEAVGLYESLGYHLIANYGDYAQAPRSLSYARYLEARAPTTAR
ncbi:MAG: GNAT family N-acetyltransferase [Bifidobacteriaceae bacterium]|jgi:ribosomal protein S18 acetylase RimI-like enzyme|nr:GNAT family N-acetyltransferase [Bifidobacteriaceae bacterium]